MRIASRFVPFVAAAGTVATMLSALPAAAFADVTWTLSGVAFADGGTAAGSFVTDDSGSLLSFDITTTAGSVLRAQTFDSQTGGSVIESAADTIWINSDDTNENLLLTALTGEFSAADDGAPVVLNAGSNSYESDAGLAEVEDLVGGEAIPAPEPMSVALLISGLVGLAASRRRNPGV